MQRIGMVLECLRPEAVNVGDEGEGNSWDASGAVSPESHQRLTGENPTAPSSPPPHEI